MQLHASAATPKLPLPPFRPFSERMYFKSSQSSAIPHPGVANSPLPSPDPYCRVLPSDSLYQDAISSCSAAVVRSLGCPVTVLTLRSAYLSANSGVGIIKLPKRLEEESSYWVLQAEILGTLNRGVGSAGAACIRGGGEFGGEYRRALASAVDAGRGSMGGVLERGTGLRYI